MNLGNASVEIIRQADSDLVRRLLEGRVVTRTLRACLELRSADLEYSGVLCIDLWTIWPPAAVCLRGQVQLRSCRGVGKGYFTARQQLDLGQSRKHSLNDLRIRSCHHTKIDQPPLPPPNHDLTRLILPFLSFSIFTISRSLSMMTGSSRYLSALRCSFSISLSYLSIFFSASSARISALIWRSSLCVSLLRLGTTSERPCMELDSPFSSSRYSVLWVAVERDRRRDLLGLRTISMAEGPELPLEELRARE